MDLHGLSTLMISTLHMKKHEGQRGEVTFPGATALISGIVGTITQICHSSKSAILLSYP